MSTEDLGKTIEKNLKEFAIPWLKKFVEIPNLSRNFDPEFSSNGLIQKAADLCLEYSKVIDIKGFSAEVDSSGQTPLIFGEIEASSSDLKESMVFYGHLDKQPHMTEGWAEGLHPTKAVEKDNKLFGRGSVDDGYNWFVVLAIVKSYQELGLPHSRMILFFETDEESDSIDIEHYMTKYKSKLSDPAPSFLFCLDGGSISPQILALGNSLRGCLTLDLKVKILEAGVHSGVASGVVPSSFRIARQLLSRIENENTGKMMDQLQVEIPEDKMKQAQMAVQIIGGDTIKNMFPFVKGAHPVSEDALELYLNNTWRPQLELVGQEGIPTKDVCGNVLRSETTLRLSVRTAPTMSSKKAFDIIKETLEANPPYGSEVACTLIDNGDGWACGKLPEKTVELINKHSMQVFGTPTLMLGQGGSIPFIKTIQDSLPETILIVTGLVLPDSCMHGPNECVDLDYMQKFCKCISGFILEHSAPSKAE